MKIQINDTNYSYYKKIFEIITSHVFKLVPPELLKNADPIEIMNARELTNKTLAKRSLKDGLLDMISQIKEFPQELKDSINRDLAATQLPSLIELQGTVKKIIARVLKRQQIKTNEEFYIVKEEVIDLGSDLTDTDRKVLDKCLYEFEISKK